MSYRNPQQVVDTQSGQAFAELQKTISGTFAGVASAYKKEQDEEAARLKKIAEENKIAARYYQRKEDQVTENLAKLKAKNPALNIGEEFTGIIDTYSDIMNMIQNGTITDPKKIAEKRAEAASILAIPDQVRTSIESFSASSIDLEKVLKQKGKMGGYDLYSNPELLKDLQVFLDQRPGERKIKINSDNGVYSASIEITSEDGKPNTYSLDVLESFLSGGTDMINSIPDETTHLNNMSNTYVYDVDESTGNKTIKETLLMGEGTEINEKGKKVTYRKVNKEALRNSIKADVKSNIDSMKTTNAKVAFFNNILADKNVRNEFTGKIATIENVDTDEFQEEFIKKYTDYFLARQPNRLVVRTEKVETPSAPTEGQIRRGIAASQAKIDLVDIMEQPEDYFKNKKVGGKDIIGVKVENIPAASSGTGKGASAKASKILELTFVARKADKDGEQLTDTMKFDLNNPTRLKTLIDLLPDNDTLKKELKKLINPLLKK